MKISFITTVYNEEKTVEKLLTSIFKQTRVPDEVVIVDGGSTDATASVISNFQFSIFNKKIKVKFLKKKGNRSEGRNFAIKNASGDVIVCSDAGCILNRNWVKNITRSFKNKKVQVVAGYYSAKPKSVFEKCLVPYVLVMPDRVDENNFLPATRSLAFKKSVWTHFKFDEHFSHNEDYVFARILQENNIKIAFERNAIVYWTPRADLIGAFIMFFRFAFGDAEAGIARPKVVLVFGRYITGLVISSYSLFIIHYLLLAYVVWSIYKNYKYVRDVRAFYILPTLQFTSDLAVLSGTSIGLFKSLLK